MSPITISIKTHPPEGNIGANIKVNKTLKTNMQIIKNNE